MIEHPSKLLLGMALLTIAGCATVPEHDAALDDARLAVNAARSNPQVVTYAPVELDRAVATLHDADVVTARNGPGDQAHNLALLASQRAALAEDAARSRSAQAALISQHNAQTAQMQADLSRQQAETAQLQAAAAQRQAEEAQRQAAATQMQAQAMQLNAAPASELVGIPALSTSRGIVITLEDTTFDPGSSELRPSGMDTVRRIAAYLAAHPGRVVAIEGFADASAAGPFDRDLSQQRVLVVQSALVGLGVDPRRTIVRPYGPEYPIASKATAAGRQMNRRVEIVVSDRDGVIAPRG